jgi:hypothetical protein
MELDVRLIILPHLRDDLRIHILSVSVLWRRKFLISLHFTQSEKLYLKHAVQHHNCLVELLLLRGR